MPGPYARAHGGSPPPGVVDFSAPANPLGPPPIIDEALRRCASERVHYAYPTRLYSALYESASQFLGASQDEVLLLNGSAEALSLIPLVLRAKELVVVEPNFGDHQLMASGLGLRLSRPVMKPEGHRFVIDIDEVVRVTARAEQPSLVIVSRPNNPTGLGLSVREVDELSSRLPRGSTLLVDEAFVDLSPLEPLVAREDLIVLRSFTKALAIPGLRLGAVLTGDSTMLSRLQAASQAWPIDSLTACAYARALGTREVASWVRKGRELAASEAKAIAEGLRGLGLEVFDSSAPFVLVRHRAVSHPELQRLLVSKGFYVRDASSFYSLGPEFSRISVRLPEENSALITALKEVLRRGP